MSGISPCRKGDEERRMCKKEVQHFNVEILYKENSYEYELQRQANIWTLKEASYDFK